MFFEESFFGEFVGIFNGVINVDVVEKDIFLYGLDFVVDGINGFKVGGVFVFEVVGVFDFVGSLDVFVGRVVNVRSRLFVFVVGVFNYGFGLGVIVRNISVFGVGDSGGDLVIIFFIILIFGFLGFGVGDGEGFIDELVSRLSGIFIDNFVWGIFILVIGFFGIGVLNMGFINLVFGFFVFGVVNFFGRVD